MDGSGGLLGRILSLGFFGPQAEIQVLRGGGIVLQGPRNYTLRVQVPKCKLSSPNQNWNLTCFCHVFVFVAMLFVFAGAA